MSDGIKLGDQVKHVACDLTGIATGLAVYLGGVSRVQVTMPCTFRDLPVSEWFDEGLLTVIAPDAPAGEDTPEV